MFRRPPHSSRGLALSPRSLYPRVADVILSEAKNPSVPSDHTTQHSRIRDRFTRTADQFSRFALSMRAAEVEHLAGLVSPRGTELALDLACGPGTFANAFAPRTRFLFGFDLTPAMLDRARSSAAAASLANVAFACADAYRLPLPSASLDLAVCGYSIHHMLEPASTLSELARVLRPGGRLALVDLIVPAGASSDANNLIERTRDASHATTLTVPGFSALIAAAGLRLFALETTERLRQFDDWMLIAGHAPGSPDYLATRLLMEADLSANASGFRPRAVASSGSALPAFEFLQTSLFLLAEKS